MTAVKDIMKPCAYVVRPEWTLREAAEILAGHHVDIAPVVSEAGIIVGLISEEQLLDLLFDLPLRESRVSEYLDTQFFTLRPHDPLSRVARLFAMHTFQRVPVAEGKRLVGIISRRDLIEYALKSTKSLADPLTEFVPALGSVT